MIKENQLIKMKWSSRCAYLRQLGYEYTGRGTEFYVKAEDICKTSHKKVILVCDKCGKEFQGGLREHYERDHDYCSKCKTILTKQTCLERYGVDNPSKVEDFKEKRTNTILGRFGVENAFQSEEIKEKIKQHYLDKYGVEYNSQVKQIKRKREETCLQKYGVKYPSQNKEILEKQKATTNAKTKEEWEFITKKRKETCIKKYGYDTIMKVPFFAQKCMKTVHESLRKTGHGMLRSRPELKMVQMLKDMYDESDVLENEIFGQYFPDAILLTDKDIIDVEYDGYYWHLKKKESDEKRDMYMVQNGLKVLRIIAHQDTLTKEQLEKALKNLLESNKDIYKIHIY